MAGFETACEAKQIALWVLPTRSPRTGGRVERMQATWRDEFHAVSDPPRRIARLDPLIDAFARRYNHVRPANALDGATPAQYLEPSSAEEASASHMCRARTYD